MKNYLDGRPPLYHVINCAYTHFIRLNAKLCMHLPLFISQMSPEAKSTSASVRSRHYKQPASVVGDILYSAASVGELCQIKPFYTDF